MALTTSVVTALVVVALILAVIISAAIWQFCARKHDFVQRNTGDTIRFTLNGRKTTEQIEVRKSFLGEESEFKTSDSSLTLGST